MLWPKQNSYKEFDNEKEFLRLENSPPPPPRHNCSNGQSLTGDGCLREPCFEKRSGLIVFTELIVSGSPDSEIREISACGIRNAGKFSCGIRNPGLWNLEHGLRNPESL